MRFAAERLARIVAPAAGHFVHRQEDEHPGDAEQDET
jgi:hypothetical protein